MAIVSAPPCHSLHGSFGSSSSGSVRSLQADVWDSRRSLEEIQEELSPRRICAVNTSTDAGSDLGEEVYVAVGIEVKDGKKTLIWALRNFRGVRRVVLVHVHRPSPLISVLGGGFRPSQLTKQQVNAHRQQERGKVYDAMEQYLLICKTFKVHGEKLVLEMDDIAKGLMETIHRIKITKFVMGAAADKHYSERMEMPKSKTARAILKESPPSCKIWFVCRGNLVCAREGLSPSAEVQQSLPNPDNGIDELYKETPKNQSLESVPFCYDDSKDGKNAAPTTAVFHGSEETKDRIQNSSIVEQGNATGLKYLEERKHHKDIKDILAKENMKVKQLKNQLDVILNRSHLADEQKTALQMQILESELIMKNLEEDLLEAQLTASSINGQIKELQQLQDEAFREYQALFLSRQESNSNTSASNLCMEFSYLELANATCGFEASQMIGEGGYGCVYKGILRHTMVAIKILRPGSFQGIAEFQQEVNILSKVRHPHLVTLVGTCPEKMALVYEFLPNGSLEDCLTCKENGLALTWQNRIRISFEICSALIFLHLAKPHGIVHGDLKPANILLDTSFACKLSDFGISRLLIESNTTNTPYHRTEPKGTLVYMDPEFLSTGELTPLSDVFSFGIILLRLLTGRPAARISRVVQEAVENGRLQEMVDPTAGSWPFVQVQQLAQLGLWCCEVERKKRPDLAKDVMSILRPLMDTSSSSLLYTQKNNEAPLYFRCPILEDVMRDPQVAADGHTYEADAIKGWLEKGHCTSPVTKQPLTHHNIVPNHALRSAIQEWLHCHKQ